MLPHRVCRHLHWTFMPALRIYFIQRQETLFFVVNMWLRFFSSFSFISFIHIRYCFQYKSAVLLYYLHTLFPTPPKDKNMDRLFEKTKDPQNDSSVCALPIHRALYITATEANNRQWSSREISSRRHGLGIGVIWLVSALLYPKPAG